jgi:uncharacterized small protein (DUF1192 family)
MARIGHTISVPPDLEPYIQQFTANHGNLSALCSDLLKTYFTGAGSGSMTGLMSAELAGRLSSLQEEMKRITADMERFKGAAEEATAADAERAAGLAEMIHQIYHEVDEMGLTEWRRESIGYGGNDLQFAHAIGVRCGSVARRAGISEVDARAAILREYPDLEAYL